MKNIGDKRVGYKTALFISFNYLFKSLSNQFLNLSNLWEYFTVQWLVRLHIGLNWNVSISPLFKTEIETLRSLTNIPSLMKFWFGLSQKVWPHLSKIQFPVQNNLAISSDFSLSLRMIPAFDLHYLIVLQTTDEPTFLGNYFNTTFTSIGKLSPKQKLVNFTCWELWWFSPIWFVVAIL